jgi:hypothetical protein
MEKVTAAAETDPGPSSGELLGAEFQKRRRKMFIGAAVGILAIGGAIAAFVMYGQRKATVRANDAFSSLSMCLFGESGPTDHPGRAFRQAQLGSMGFPEKSRGQVDGVAWPQRCAGEAQDLLDRAKDAGLTSGGSKDVAYWADQLAKRLKAPDAHLADASDAIENTIAEAKKAGLTIRAAPSTKGPPGTAAARPADELAAAALVTKQPFPLKEFDLEKSPGEVQFALVQDATVSPPVFLCDFQAAGMECAKLPDNLTKAGHGLTLGGSTDKGASPLIFEGNRGDGGVFRSDTGEEIAKVFAYGGSATASGGAFVLGWDDAKQEPFIASRDRGAPKARRENVKTSFSAVNAFFKPQMLWGQVFLPGTGKHSDTDASEGDAPAESDKRDNVVTNKGDKKKFEPGIFVLPIDEKKGTAGEPVRILPLRTDAGEGTESHIVGCKTDKALIIVAWGAGNDVLTFHIDGQWTKPLVWGLRGSLTCDGATLATASIETGQTPWEGSIYETHCTSAKCENSTLELKTIIPGGLELAPREAHGAGTNLIDAIEVADKLVVAWAAGDRGGIRVRVGATHEIEDAKDVVALDDRTLDGKPVDESTVTDLRLIHAPGHAVLLLSTKAGVLALRVDPSGEVSPEKVTWK